MLRQRLEPVLHRRVGVAIAIWGEPGIGKSHAAERLLAELPCRSLRVLAASPLPALAGLVPRTSRLAGWATATLERVRSGVPVEPPRVIEAIAAALARSAPFVLHVEDLHEADTDRQGLFVELAATLRRTHGVGMLVTSRTDPGEPFQRVRLQPLRRDEVRELLVGAIGSELPAEATEWITSKSAGNPLFALEYLRYLGRQGNLWSDGKTWHWRRPAADAPPPTVEALIEYFLHDVLGDPHLAPVAVAKSLLPAGAPDDLEARAAGLSATAFRAATHELERRGVLTNGSYVHPLYREVVGRTVAPEERRDTARRALTTPDLGPGTVATLVADAGLAGPAAVDLLQSAAGAARESGDTQGAARLLALASGHASGEESGLLALEAARLLSGRDYPLMLQLAERAAAVLADPTEALLVQAGGLSIQGDHEALQAVIDRLPDEAKRGAAWLQRHVRLLHQAGLREELIAVWEASPHKDECDSATVYFVGWAYLHAGSPRSAAALVEERLARTPTDDAGAAELKELQASIAFYLGDNEAAERAFTELLEKAEAARGFSPPNVANLLRNRAVARMQQARYGDCLPDLEAALRIYEEVGHGLHHAGTLVMMSYAYEELGAYERAEEVLSEALETVRRSGAARFEGGVLAQLADLYLEWPGRAHPTLALRYATQAFEATAAYPDGLETITARYLLSRAKTATGRAAEGLELAEQALAQAAAAEVAEAALAARFAMGLALENLGRVDEALEAFVDASRQALERGLPLHHHRYGLEADRLTADRDRAAERTRWFADRGLQHGVNLANGYFPPSDQRAVGAPTTAPFLRLELLGPLQLRRGVGTAPVRGRRRQALLLALADGRLSGRPEVDRLTLLEALYPERDEVKATASLKQLVSDLRKDLGARSIETTATGYALGEVATDVEEFMATGDPKLWRGGLGEGVAWDLSASVLDRLLEALAAAAHAALDTDPAEAARAAALLRRHDPYDAGHLRLQLDALKRAALPRALDDEYAKARSVFAEVGETLPETASAFLRS